MDGGTYGRGCVLALRGTRKAGRSGAQAAGEGGGMTCYVWRPRTAGVAMEARCICCAIAVDAREDYCYGCGFHVCQPCAQRHRHEEDDAHMVPGINARVARCRQADGPVGRCEEAP